MVLTSGAPQPFSPTHAVLRRLRRPSSLASLCEDQGRVEISSSPWLRWEIASISAMRFNARSPAACHSGMAASARPAAVR